jgi:drug/metabolite transporter (DMT)-like permease
MSVFEAAPSVLQRNKTLIIATLTNIVTYSTWTLLNKWQFIASDKQGFSIVTPLFVTGIQMVIAGAVAAFAIFVLGIQNRRIPGTNRRDPSAPPLLSVDTFRHRILPLGLARCVDIGGGNSALVAVSVALQQVIKSLLPIFVSLLSATVLKKPVSFATWLSLIPVVGGTVIATVGGPVAPSVYGIACATVSCFARSFKCVLNAKLLAPSSGKKADNGDDPNQKPLLPLEILLMEAPTSGVFLLIIAAFVEGDKIAATMPLLIAAAPLNILGGVLMFANQASYITVIEQSSAVTCQVLMNLKMLLLIMISVQIYNTPFSAVNYGGVLIATAGCVLYALIAARPQPRPASPKRTGTGLV